MASAQIGVVAALARAQRSGSRAVRGNMRMRYVIRCGMQMPKKLLCLAAHCAIFEIRYPGVCV